MYMFDWRALRRWGFKESNLPPGSVLLYRQPTAWELYNGYIIGSISLILVEALLIFGLLWQRARRRKAEAELAIAYERLRLALTAGKSVDGIGTSGAVKIVGLVTSKLCSEFDRTPIPSASRSFAAAYIRKTESLSGKGLPTPYEIISLTYRNSASCVLTEPCGGSQLTEASITP